MTKANVIKDTVSTMNGKILHFAVNETAMIYANEQKRVTKNLTSSAQGADGKRMPNLTAGYKRLKMAAGGKGIRNLRLSGGLMNSLTVSLVPGLQNSRSAILAFGSEYTKIVEGNQSYAEFFGIHPTALRFAEVETVKQFNALR